MITVEVAGKETTIAGDMERKRAPIRIQTSGESSQPLIEFVIGTKPYILKLSKYGTPVLNGA